MQRGALVTKCRQLSKKLEHRQGIETLMLSSLLRLVDVTGTSCGSVHKAKDN